MSAKKRLPRILFIEDVARELRCSPSTIKRRLRADAFPVPPLPGIDKRWRWSAASIKRYFQGADPRVVSRGRR